MARHLNYYDIDLDDEWTCECGATFRVGDEMETHDSLYDVHCPACQRMVLVVAYPTPEQTRRAAASGNSRALADLDDANRIERRWRRIEELQLKSAVWRELAIYEGMDRFLALRGLLREAYAPRPVRLTVTEPAQTVILGDRHTWLPEG